MDVLTLFLINYKNATFLMIFSKYVCTFYFNIICSMENNLKNIIFPVFALFQKKK